MNKTSTILIVIIILGIVVILYGIFNNKKCKSSDSNLSCVKKMGAVKSTESGVGERYDYPKDPNNEYGFYSNNRAVRFSDSQKGTYNKVKITWDDGSVTKLKDIFKK